MMWYGQHEKVMKAPKLEAREGMAMQEWPLELQLLQMQAATRSVKWTYSAFWKPTRDCRK